MKKLMVLFGVISFLISASGFAYINESETSSIDTLKAQGFSQSTLEIVDTVKSKSPDKNKTYRTYYKRKDHHYLGKVYKYVKEFVDPVQDDGIFGEHTINFSNTWNGDDTKYSSEKESAYQVENL